MSDNGFMIDMTVNRNRRFVQLVALIGRLRIEVKTGMHYKGVSTLNIAQRDFGVRSRTKQGALEELQKIKAQEYPEVAGATDPR